MSRPSLILERGISAFGEGATLSKRCLVCAVTLTCPSWPACHHEECDFLRKAK